MFNCFVVNEVHGYFKIGRRPGKKQLPPLSSKDDISLAAVFSHEGLSAFPLIKKDPISFL